jgi:hypothetical protein
MPSGRSAAGRCAGHCTRRSPGQPTASLVTPQGSAAEQLDLDSSGGGKPAAVNESLGRQARFHDRDAGRAVPRFKRAAAVGPL